MLVLGRKPGEVICVGDDVEIMVCAVIGGNVRVGIKAPKHVAVHRKEMYEQLNSKDESSSKDTQPTNQPLTRSNQVNNEWTCWPEGKKELAKKVYGEALTAERAALLAADFFDGRTERIGNGLPPAHRRIVVSHAGFEKAVALQRKVVQRWSVDSREGGR